MNLPSGSYCSQFRCSLSGFIEPYRGIKAHILEAHKTLLEATPFANFFKAVHEDQIDMSRKNDHTLESIIKQYSPLHKGFKIGSRHCPLERSDLKLVFGIRDGVEPINLCIGPQQYESDFRSRVFRDTPRCSTKHMKSELKVVVLRNDPESVADTCRLLCLLLLGCVLVPTQGKNLIWDYCRLVEDLQGMRRYDWSSNIMQLLQTSLDSKSYQPKSVIGCTIFLMYWICEHCRSITSNRPFLICWYMSLNHCATLSLNHCAACICWYMSQVALGKSVNVARTKTEMLDLKAELVNRIISNTSF